MVSRGFLIATVSATLAVGLSALTQVAAWAQASPVATAIVPAESGARWADLSAAHRVALRPLERDWASIGADQKQKWIELAGRFPALSADERDRVQARMADWARMTPRERGQARINFQEAKQASPADRRAQWEAYQALPEDQKRQLAARAVPPPKATAPIGNVEPSDTPSAKSNLVPNPAHAQPLRQVAPTVVQAQPGATTMLITKRPAPPAHQQTGLPKIAATPEFVDKATLLPQRGPQGAATQSASASQPQAVLRR